MVISSMVSTAPTAPYQLKAPTAFRSVHDAPSVPDLLAIIEGACATESVRRDGWSVIAPHDGDAPWIVACRDGHDLPAQGWKLHVSAGVGSAEVVLRRVLPVLLSDDADFKVAASLDALGALNDGRGGVSQIGKFITVYPRDDTQAVRMAKALDEVTRGLRGPAIPSDRPLRRGSLVHYRFGSFGQRLMQTPLGETTFALETPDGQLVPDERTPVFRSPDWVTDPFRAAGAADELPALQPLIADRYLILTPIHRSARGAVFLGLDIDGNRQCVIKQARRDAQLMADGRDARDALRHEAWVMRMLTGESPSLAPRFIDLVTHDDDLFLIMEDVEGETLDRAMARRIIQGRLMTIGEVVALGRQLAALLGQLHAKGWVYRDLKSANVLLVPDRQIRLIDFELVQTIGSTASTFGIGTRGYMPPEQESGSPPAVTDDLYALGALLSFLATGAEPSNGPDRCSPLTRPLSLLNPSIDSELAAVISRCLASDPADRFPSMASLDAALVAIADRAVDPNPPRFGCNPAAVPETGTFDEMTARSRAGRFARQLGDTICAAARPSANNGVYWLSEHHLGGTRPGIDLNVGCAGTLLALAEIVDQWNDPVHRETLGRGIDWLIDAPALEGEPLPGLYVGAAGIATALLRTGQILDRPDLIELARQRSAWIASLPYRSPDLFNGTAGRLRFHLLLWDETGDRNALAAAVSAGNSLLKRAQHTDHDGLCWTVPDGYGSLSNKASLGYAHGAAGIADALLDLYEATGDDRFLQAATGTVRWLARHRVSVLPDERGRAWPSDEGDAPTPGFWCHGAAGIGRFLLHATKVGIQEVPPDAVEGAARAVAHGTRWAGPTQCHGLAGNIEFLLDLYQSTGDRRYLVEARSLGQLLEAFAHHRDGLLVWPSDSPSVVTPDYMIGYAGVAACLLRLANPEHRPHGLSRAGFRYRVTAEATSDV